MSTRPYTPGLPFHLGLLLPLLAVLAPGASAQLTFSTPDTILESDQASSGTLLAPLMGASVASAGDVNGDGFDDVIVGAPGWDRTNGLYDEGAAFVFLGGPGGVVGSDPSTAHAVIQSDDARALFGTSVAGVGDVNGDGYDDVLVGSPLADASALPVSGAAYLFLGGATGITATTVAHADAVLESKQREGHMGASVAGAGDVNGDGYDDVIIGAETYGKPFSPPIPNQGSGRQGAAFVFLGGPGGLVGRDPSTAHAQLVPWTNSSPSQHSALFGTDVSSAGDVNGDGYDDVLVGSPRWNQSRPWPGVPGGDPPEEGAAFVFLGGPDGIVGRNPSNAHARIEGGQLEALLGHAVASAGDVNGDGFGDIVVGATGYPAGDPLLGSQEGAAFVFLGGASGIQASGPSGAQARFSGSGLAEWIGYSVSSAGDLDGDGFGDIAVGAREAPGSLRNEGVVYVFRGGPSGVVGNGLSDAYGVIRSGQAETFLGSAVSSAGDVDGDGISDLLVGVTGHTNGEAFEGGAYLYQSHGTPGPGNQLPLPKAGADQLLTDTDGDGFATATLDGSGSSDPDGALVGYRWTEGGVLLGSAPQLVVALPVGEHALSLQVTDDQGASASDDVLVRVQPSVVVPQGEVRLDGTTLVDRGDPVVWSVTVTNTGTTAMTDVRLTLGLSAGDLVKDLSPATVLVPSVPAGGSVTRTWTGRADRRGLGTVRANITSGPTSIGTESLALTVQK